MMLAKFLAGLIIFSGGLFETKWEKETSEDGVTVWMREVEGTGIKQVKSSGVIKAHPDTIWAGLQDRGKFLKVMPFVVESKDVGKCGDTCKYSFQMIHRPPLKDRGYVIEVNWTRTEEDGKIVIDHRWKKAKGQSFPAGVKAQDVKNIYGRWSFVSDDGGKTTKFTYISFLDMGAMVPVGMVNSSIKENALKFVINLKAKAPTW